VSDNSSKQTVASLCVVEILDTGEVSFCDYAAFSSGIATSSVSAVRSFIPRACPTRWTDRHRDASAGDHSSCTGSPYEECRRDHQHLLGAVSLQMGSRPNARHARHTRNRFANAHPLRRAQAEDPDHTRSTCGTESSTSLSSISPI